MAFQFESLRKRSSSSIFESILSEKAQVLYENDNSPIKDLPSPDRVSSSIRLGKVAIDGDEATVKVKVKLRGKYQDTTLHLRQETDRWVVYAISAVGPNDDVQTIHFEDD